MAVRTRVAESSRAARAPVKGWQRHLEGWQVGLLAVVIAGSAALLAVPRAVPPSDVPDPAVRPAEIDAVRRADAALAADIEKRAMQGELDYDVRMLGRAIGLFGRAESGGNGAELEAAHRAIAESLPAALARGLGEVRALRAHQTHSFLREIRAFERTGSASLELIELAGTFPESAQVYGWYDRQAHRFAPDDTVLMVMFKKRWNEVVGVKGPPFALTLDEQRALLGFLIAHPAVPSAPLAEAPGSSLARSAAARRQVTVDERRIEKVRELARLDPEYPGSYAEGILLYRLGRFERAAGAFERHLAGRPEGPLTLRARNFLKASLEAR